MTKSLSRASQAAWQKHIDAQATSGPSQSDYCRAHQLGIKYFSFWKSKLRKTTKPAVSVNDNSITSGKMTSIQMHDLETDLRGGLFCLKQANQ